MTVIQALLALYQVDSQVRGLRSRLDSAQRHLDVQSRQLNAMMTTRQELEARARQYRAGIDALELETKVLDERTERLRTTLNTSATSKQYTAIQTELNSVKESRKGFEDRELEQMAQLEKVQAEIAAIEPQIADRTRLRDRAKQDLEERQADIGTRLAELEKERAAAAAVLPAEALALFDEMAHVHEGEAMAAVEVVDRRNKEYACAACRLHLPFQLVSHLVDGGDNLIRCSNCKRILYLADEVRGGLVKKS